MCPYPHRHHDRTPRVPAHHPHDPTTSARATSAGLGPSVIRPLRGRGHGRTGVSADHWGSGPRRYLPGSALTTASSKDAKWPRFSELERLRLSCDLFLFNRFLVSRDICAGSKLIDRHLLARLLRFDGVRNNVSGLYGQRCAAPKIARGNSECDSTAQDRDDGTDPKGKRHYGLEQQRRSRVDHTWDIGSVNEIASCWVNVVGLGASPEVEGTTVSSDMTHNSTTPTPGTQEVVRLMALSRSLERPENKPPSWRFVLSPCFLAPSLRSMWPRPGPARVAALERKQVKRQKKTEWD